MKTLTELITLHIKSRDLASRNKSRTALQDLSGEKYEQLGEVIDWSYQKENRNKNGENKKQLIKFIERCLPP